MRKKLEFYPPEKCVERFQAILGAALTTTTDEARAISSKRPKEVSKADPKAVGKRLDRP